MFKIFIFGKTAGKYILVALDDSEGILIHGFLSVIFVTVHSNIDTLDILFVRCMRLKYF